MSLIYNINPVFPPRILPAINLMVRVTEDCPEVDRAEASSFGAVLEGKIGNYKGKYRFSDQEPP